jgi:hypothetical protein
MLTDEKIEQTIWEDFDLPLDKSDIDKQSENYIAYTIAVKWAKWARDEQMNKQ